MDWMLDKEIRRELPAEWNEVVPTEAFVEEATRLVEQAKNKNLVLRIIGGLGIAIHCRDFRDFALRLGRIGTGVTPHQEYSDLDFVSYRKHREQVKTFFTERGYAKRRTTLSSAASDRQIYYHPKGWFSCDVFFDRLLVANHPINFEGRLELDYPTISTTDLLLEKIQIWEAFSAKDLKDCMLLLISCQFEDKGAIDLGYVAKVLSEDWGFWYTATTNLNKIHRFISEIDLLGSEVGIDPKNVSKEERIRISKKVEELLEAIEDAPKSFGWRMRAKIGTKKKWYNPVERPDTVGGFGLWEAIK